MGEFVRKKLVSKFEQTNDSEDRLQSSDNLLQIRGLDAVGPVGNKIAKIPPKGGSSSQR